MWRVPWNNKRRYEWVSGGNEVRKDNAGMDSSGCRTQGRRKWLSMSGSTQPCDIGHWEKERYKSLHVLQITQAYLNLKASLVLKGKWHGEKYIFGKSTWQGGREWSRLGRHWAQRDELGANCSSLGKRSWEPELRHLGTRDRGEPRILIDA